MTEMRSLKLSSSSSSEAEGDDECEVQVISYHKPKRDRNENLEASSSSKKKKIGSKVDLEELLARTYPKDVSAAEQTEGGLRRSKRNKKKAAKTFIAAEFVKKWTGDEEIRVAMALLESSSPEGGLNMSEFYQRGKLILNYEVSNCQLYDKMRRMKRRFMGIQSAMEQGHVPEHRIEFRTPQEPALFKIWQRIWGQNNNAEQLEAVNLNIRANDAENANPSPNPRATEARNPDARAEHADAGVNGATNPNPGLMEFENTNPRVWESRKPKSTSSAAENPIIHNSIVIEIGNPDPRPSEEIGNPDPRASGEIGNPDPRPNEEVGNPPPSVSQAGNSNYLVNEVVNPFVCASGAEKPKSPNLGVIEEPDPREIKARNPGPRLVEAENPNPNGPEAEECNGDTSAGHVCGHAIDKGGVTRSRSEINHNSGFANFQASSGFGSEIVIEDCNGSCLSKKIKRLANAANNVKYSSHPELHQKYRQHYVNQLKLLYEHLELVQEECKLWLDVLEAPNRSPEP